MGKGDRKTKRGKITKGTYGVSRLKKKNKKRKNTTVLVKSGRKRPVKRSTRKKTGVKELVEKKQVETLAETTGEIKVDEDKAPKEITEKGKPENEKTEKGKPSIDGMGINSPGVIMTCLKRFRYIIE